MVLECKSVGLLPRDRAKLHENDIYTAYNMKRMTSCAGSTLRLSRDSDLDFDTGLQANARLRHTHRTSEIYE